MGRRKTIDDEGILSRARAVFRAGGHGASTREVARAVGISQAVLFQRFGSKEELFGRAMLPDLPDVGVLLGPYPPADVLQDLTRIAGGLADYLGELMPTLIHVLAHPGIGRERLLETHRRLAFHPLLSALEERFGRLAADGLVRGVDARAAARTFLAVVHSAAQFQAMAHPGVATPPRAQVEELLRVLWSGLAPDGSGPGEGRREGAALPGPTNQER